MWLAWLSDDPRAFTSRPVGHRMIVVSAGVVFNLLFAAVLLMAVFLVGKQMPSPVIGWVHPNGPAQGKLFPGDRVLELDGRRVDSFTDVRMGAVLAAFLIGFAQILTVVYWGAHYQMVVALLAIILTLIVQPSGLFGRQKELEERV